MTSTQKRFRGGLIVCGLGLLAALVMVFRFGDHDKPSNTDFRHDLSAPQDQSASSLPRVSTDRGFVSSSACRDCHLPQYESWHASYHRTMTQLVSPDTVIGDFDGQVLEHHGRRFQVMRDGDAFLVSMPDPDREQLAVNAGLDLREVVDIAVVEREVVMSTGSHHYQGYWVGGNDQGVLRQFPFVYHIKDQQWLPRDDVLLHPPDQPPTFPVWNNSCIECHTVGAKPGYDANHKWFSSEVAELGIACEACHGPGKSHVEWHQSAMVSGAPSDRRPAIAAMVNPARRSSRVSTQICGRCHTATLLPKEHAGSWIRTGDPFLPGDDLEATHRVMRIDSGIDGAKDHFWRDGAANTGGREYLGLTESACYKRGEISCLSCHSMHASAPNDQLAAGMLTNHACLQCHQEYEHNVVKHTHHPPNSAGSLCYNCHMPHTSFALLGAIRSHRIDNPSVKSSMEFGRPNACNLCHLDRSLAWTASQLSEWYGIDSPHIDSDSDDAQISAAVQWVLKGDALQRAVTAWHFGWDSAQDVSDDSWFAPILAHLLDDSYAVVRYVAGHALSTLPGFEDLAYDYVAPPAELKAAQQQALSQWNALPKRVPVGEVPFDSNGQLKKDVVLRLLNEQDQRRVNHAE